jgi:hypothetical protein
VRESQSATLSAVESSPELAHESDRDVARSGNDVPVMPRDVAGI